MRLFSRTKSVSLSMAIALLLPPVCMAQTSCLAQLDECEKTLVGKTAPNLPVTARVEALERNLFGTVHSGSMAERLHAIKVTLAGAGTPAAAPAAPVAMKPRPVAPVVNLAPAKPKVQSNQSTLKAQKPMVVPPPAPSPEPAEQPMDPEAQAEHIKELLKQAIISHTQGDLAGAKKNFEKVLALDPNNTDANYNLGAMAEDHGDLDAALGFYHKAATNAPDDSDIRNAATSVERKIKKRDMAQGAIPDSGKLADLAKDAANAFKTGNYDGAISDLNLIAAEEPGDATIQYGLSRAWHRKGDLTRARHHLTRAIALAPDQQMYPAALENLDKEIQAKASNPNTAIANEQAQPSEMRTATRQSNDANQAAMNQQQPVANQNPGGIVPFTDQGAPRPLVGGVNQVANGNPMLGSEVPVVASTYGAVPAGAYVMNPFDQAVAGTLAGMAALTGASRAAAYPVYPSVRVGRIRIGRAGSLAGGLLGLFGVGY